MPSEQRRGAELHTSYRAFATALCIAIAQAAPAYSGTVWLDWQSNGSAGIVIEGSITPETRFELSWGAFQIRERGGEILAYVLDSLGGNVEAAAGLAYDIRHDDKPVMLLSGAKCISACFLLISAAREKFLAPDAIVGIHSASTPAGQESWDSFAATAYIAKLAAQDGIPDFLIGRLVSTPADQVYVLTADDMNSIPGAHVLRSVAFDQFTKHSKLVSKYWAGYAAGAYIAAGRSTYTDCDFQDRVFLAACLQGLHDAPPEGWAKGFFSRNPEQQ